MNPALNYSPKDLFVYWVEERQRVYLKKEVGLPKPWSDNKVFQTTYFCNVDREQDRVTKWIREFYSPHVYHKDFLANIILARMVNKPETLDQLGYMDDFDHPNWLRVMSQKGAWGSAYIVSTNGRAQPKHEYVAGLLLSAFERFRRLPHPTGRPLLSVAASAIQGLQGMGTFMAGQVVADLKNTPDHWLWDAEGWWSWAAPGPGSMRGLSRFHEAPVTPANFTEALANARGWCHTNSAGLVDKLCNQNLQNCFCEFDKFARVTLGSGRSKRKYNGN